MLIDENVDRLMPLKIWAQGKGGTHHRLKNIEREIMFWSFSFVFW